MKPPSWGFPSFLDLPRLSCKPGDRIACRLARRAEDAVSVEVMGSYVLPPEDVTEDFPVVVGIVVDVDGKSGLVVLQEHGASCFLAGARMIRRGSSV